MRKSTKTIKPTSKEIAVSKDILVDERERLKLLDEETRNAYIGASVKTGYDASVFVETIVRNNGAERILYVPAAKRMRWFHVDHPTGIIVPSDPVFTPQNGGRLVTVRATVYLSAEDYKEGIPAAINMASRFFSSDDQYAVDITVTRAQSRVLRDIGYDLPGDAHEIEGWTPVFIENDATGKMPEDALESSVKITNIMPPVSSPLTSTEVATSNDISENIESQTIDAEPSHESDAKADTEVKTVPDVEYKSSDPEQISLAEPVQKPMEKPETLDTATKQKSGYKAETKPEAQDTSPIKTVPFVPVISAVQPVSPAESEKPAKTVVPITPANSSSAADIPTMPSIMSMPEFLKKAEESFGSLEEAEKYSCRILRDKTVGEQNDMRINYFVKNAVNGKLRDPMLGYAAALVANQRGILTQVVS